MSKVARKKIVFKRPPKIKNEADDKDSAAPPAYKPVDPRGKSAFQTGLVYDPRCLLHSADYVHVEAPERMSVAYALLKEKGHLKKCVHVDSTKASVDQLKRVHTADHIKQIQDFRQHDFGEDEPDSESEDQTRLFNKCVWLCSDAYVCKHSPDASEVSAGGLLRLSEQVVSGKLDNGFALIRPPGHHASKDKASGFCLYNNVAVAARHIMGMPMGTVKNESSEKVERVLIVDWDVHHGNGTEAIFYDDPNVLYFSIHRYQDSSFYPHTGATTDTGKGPGQGFNVNVPLPCVKLGDREYLEALEKVLLPIAADFKPSVVFISAGFDCALGDPLGGMEVSTECFAHMTARLMDPKIVPSQKVICALEGGYNVRAVSEAVGSCVQTLLGDSLPDLPGASAEDDMFASKRELKKQEERYKQFSKALDEVLVTQKQYWPKCLAGVKDEVDALVDDLGKGLSNLSVTVKKEEKKDN